VVSVNDPESTAPEPDEYVAELSRAMGIVQSPQRARELLPAVAAFMRDVDDLWNVDVTGHEMALRFDPSGSW
jgi:hypothetical protein